jgi:hypothetical protein
MSATTYAYKPSRWQAEFHAMPVDEGLGGGSVGPGKSMALLNDANDQIVVEHERWMRREIRQSKGWALHLRKEMPMLNQTIKRSKDLFPLMDPGAKYSENSHTWLFSSGYQYQFAHLKDPDSHENYRSNEYTWLGFDELTQIPSKDVYDELCLRVRTADPVLQKMLKIRAVTNPGAGWVRELYIDPNPNGREIHERMVTRRDGTKKLRTRMFLPAKLWDNPDPEFVASYEASLLDRPKHIRAALLEGNWYVVAGAFFADLWDTERVVIKKFTIPTGWHRFRSGDWGYKEECVILWWAVTPDRELICYRERTFNGTKAKRRMDAGEVARAIKEVEMANGEWNRLRNCSRLTGPMDNQLWEERGRKGPTMADDMAKEGVYWQRATKGRVSMAQQLITRLGQKGYDGRPGIMFFEDCQKCIQTIPSIGTDELEPEKPKDGGPDHWYAAVGYACAANPVPSGKEDRANDNDDDDEGGNNGAPFGGLGEMGYGGW